jgi:hypothetical protein
MQLQRKNSGSSTSTAALPGNESSNDMTAKTCNDPRKIMQKFK